MADEDLAKLLVTQKSLTEWLEDIKHKDVDSIRREDNDKRERLRILNEIIGLPYDQPVQFRASELTSESKRFKQYLNEHGDELCALRLIPTEDNLPKLRMRGKSVKFAYDWFKQQKIDTKKYRADFIPHPPDYGWSTIFVVNSKGIQGEIVFGGHHLLTQGFHNQPPILFKYDFKNWYLSDNNEEALKHLQKIVSYLLIPEHNKLAVEKALEGRFFNNYLGGYFETTNSSIGLWFIDYNRLLGQALADLDIDVQIKPITNSVQLTGRSGSHGQASGEVRIVSPDSIPSDFLSGQILICTMTTPEHVPLMRRAAAIVTDQGGILCHAAIVARELGIPCIVGTGTATTTLKNGDKVNVDGVLGTVSIIS